MRPGQSVSVHWGKGAWYAKYFLDNASKIDLTYAETIIT